MGKKVLAVVEDLFFLAKIRQAASQVGAAIVYARDSLRALELARLERPSLIIVDLNAAGCEPFELLSQLKADAELGEIPTLGFFAHLQTELQQKARQAGCDRILARSAFSQNLPAILR